MRRVEVFATPHCWYCRQARALLERKGIPYESNDAMDPARRREAMARSGRHTVPQIFIDGRSIGGYDDLRALEKSGELDALLRER
jgi:glutaredoxin 3